MDPDSAPPVDFDLLEQQKENIYPTQAGRKASALVSFFSTPSTDPADREASFKAQRADFEARIAEAARFDAERRKSTPDPSLPTYDPLELHHRYVRWFQDAYPSGHDDLLKVVEKAIRSVKHLETYKKDPRYLRLWILVAKHQEDPTAVFKYLSVNGIGQTISTYYTEYATLLEALNKYREAEEIYKLGIERRAEPLDKLKYKYNAFQRRMMLPKNSPAPDPPPSTAQPERTVQPLTTLSRPTASSRSRADPARTTTAPAPSALRTEPHHHNTASNRPLPPKIEVYRDTENAAPELGKQLLPTEADTNVWNEFEILNRSKENKMGVVPLKGAVVDIGPSTKKLAVKIEVYRDPVAETAAKENVC
ncbi:Mad3/BUB1 homology region 1-domain-containing protein [Cladochytrium replicatum]|nr:Mad3/BUB1 homology region 1-domain-containing protein [Cladochytrium replicatum]